MKKQFAEMLEELNTGKFWRSSLKAKEYAEEILEHLSSEDEELPEDIYDYLYEVTSESFIYYADAHNFLRDGGYHDFDEPISSGCPATVTAIATYFLEQEVFEILSDLGLFEKI